MRPAPMQDGRSSQSPWKEEGKKLKFQTLYETTDCKVPYTIHPATMTDDTTDLRLECICTTVSILSSGVDESTMSGVGKLLTRCLEETLSGRRYMATGAIIDVLCREDGPIARFHVSNSQNALYIRVLGVTTTWHPRAAASNRKKIFTCLLQRVSIHKGLNESEIEKCNMQARNGIKGAISMIDIEVCCHWRTDTVGLHLTSLTY